MTLAGLVLGVALVICPTCKEAGQKSTVTPGACQTTLAMPLSYYDEDGRFHYDDPNITTCQYRCSNGHEWSESSGGGVRR